MLLAACENPQPPGTCGTIADQTVVVGDKAAVSACFEDPNGDVLSYYAASSDAGVATVSVSGSTLTVTAVSPGTSVVTVTATDATQLSDDQQFRVLVPNRAPVAVGEIAARDLPAGESAAVDVSAHFMEPDGEPLTYAMAVSDESVVGISATGAVVTLGGLAKGTATVTATATDPGGLSAVQSFLVTVPNRMPGAVGTIAPRTIEVDAAVTTDVTGYFTDPDGDDLVYTAGSSDPSVTEVSISGGELTVTAIARGEATVTVTATDTEGLAATQEFVVTVPNRAPLAVGSIDERTIEVDETSSLELSSYFSDPDGDVLVYTVAISDGAVAGVEVAGGTLAVTAIAKGAATVTVTATDTDGLMATQVFEVTVPNQPPFATGSIEGRTIEVGETAAMELSGYFEDPDGDVPVYTAAASDAAVAGAVVEGETMTVTAVAKGEATVTVTATDTEGLTATQAFVVTVPNRAPIAVGSIEARTVEIGQSATLELSGFFEDADGDDLAYSVSSSDETLIAASAEGAAATVEALAKGTAVVTVTATDTEGLTAMQTFAVTVPNQPPLATGSIEGRTIEVDETASLDLPTYFTDPDGDDLAYSAVISDGAVAGIEVDGSTLTVNAIAKGAATVTVTATDTEGLSAMQEFAVTVPNRPPLAAGFIDGQTIAVGETATTELSGHFSDPDGDDLVYTAAVSDAALVDASVSVGAVTVTAVAKGEATVTVTATDTEGLTATQAFVVTVPNRAPIAVGSIEARTVEIGQSATLDLSGFFEDADGDDLAYSVSSSDETLIAASAEGAAATVEALAKGTAVVTVTATDTEGLTATQAFAVTVPNQPPLATGSIEGRTIEVDETASLDLPTYFTDPDGDGLTYSAVISDGAVAGIEVDGSTLTVNAIAKGAATVTVTATDTEGLSAMQEFAVTVPNRPPLAAGFIDGQTIAVGETATTELSGHFSDPDGDDLVYTAAVSDAALVDASVSVGAVTVTVTAVAKGEATVTVTATDTEGLTATQAFVVTVPNRAPTAVGSIEAPTLGMGERATVELSGHFEDPDGDELAYSVSSSDATLIGAAIEGATVTLEALAKGAAVVTVTAADPDGLAATQEVAVVVANRPPRAVGSIATRTVEVDENITIELPGYFNDPDDDPLAYTYSTTEASVLAVSVSGGAMTVTALRKGLAGVVVVATDPDDMTARQEFFVAVPNRAPQAVGTVSQRRMSEGGFTRLDPRSLFTDPDGDELIFRAESSNPAVAKAWVATNGVLVRGLRKGAATVTITAEDPDGVTEVQRFGVRVRGSNGSDSNDPPVAVGQIRTQRLEEGDTRMVDASSYFDDPDDDPLEFSAESSDPVVVEATVSGSEVELEVTGLGTATVTVKAEDAGGLETTQAFGVTVAEASDANRAPALVGTIAAQTLEANEEATLDASSYFTDPDNDALEFSARSSDVEVVTVTVSGSGIELQATGPGTANVTLTAEDAGGLTAETSFGVTVLEPEGPNRAPVAYHMQPVQLKAGNSRTIDAAARFDDPDGDDLALSAESSDTEVATATISGDELEVEALAEGTTTVTVTAEDPEGLSASGEFQVTVRLPGENKPPSVTDTPDSRNFVVGGALYIQPWRYFEDPDDDYDDLTISRTSSDETIMELGNLSPAGVFQIFARSDGEATITVTATDPAGLSASFSVVHTIGNNAPKLYDGEFTLGWPSGIPVVSSPGEVDTLIARRIFQDDDWGDELSYSVSVSDEDVVKASMEWSGLYASYLRVKGLSAGEATITATATDLGGLEFEHEIPVTVSSNRPPKVKQEFADWANLTEGDTLEFILSGYFDDPDGDDLTYSALSMVQVNHAVSADTLWLTYNQGGIALVRVTATDPGGREVDQSFFVLVKPADSNSQLSLPIEAGESPSPAERVAVAFAWSPPHQPLRAVRLSPRTRPRTALSPPGRPRAHSTRGQ